MYEIKSYTIYSEYYDLITLLSEEEQKDLFYAINKYMFEGIEIELTEKEKKIFNNLKRPLDASKKKSKNGSNTKSKQNQKEIKTKSKQNQTDNQNKIKTKSNEQSKGITHQDVYVYVNGNVNVNKLFKEYLELRKKNNYTLSETVIKRLKNKLEEFGKTDEDKIEIINNAINGGWKDFYPLKPVERKKAPNWYGQEILEEKASAEEIKELERMLRNG